MTDIDADAPRARAQALRQTRLARVRAIRRRIIAGSVALFVAAWLLITVVLMSGHDPALSKSTAATVASSSGTAAGSSSGSTTNSSGSTTSSSGSTTSSSGSTNTSSGSSGGSASSVTTQQS